MHDDTIYARRPELYDAIYGFKNYGAEVLRLAELLGRLGIAPGSRVLEAGCGTGNHLVHLQHIHRVSGFDLHSGMARFAAEKVPDAAIFSADMRSFTVDPPVDALLCLFSSIGYLLDEAALREAAACFAAAVRPGGALIVEPWLTRENWRANLPYMTTCDRPDLKAARLNVSRTDGEHSVLDMHWLVARPDEEVEGFVEHHRLWMCPRETMLRVFTEAGFDVHFDPNGLLRDRGLFIGTRR